MSTQPIGSEIGDYGRLTAPCKILTAGFLSVRDLRFVDADDKTIRADVVKQFRTDFGEVLKRPSCWSARMGL
jgi:hypothetical protein